MPRKLPSVKTTEGRQAIVDWMRRTVGLSQADLRTEYDGLQIGLFMLWAVSDPHSYARAYRDHADPGPEYPTGPFFIAGAERTTIEQLEDGYWPDDDTALLMWWRVVGHQRYEDWEPGHVYNAEYRLPAKAGATATARLPNPERRSVIAKGAAAGAYS